MIEVTRLTKRYGGATALEDLSFRVLPGRVTGLLGPNGAGKSTTLRILLGLDAATSGSCLIDGRGYGSRRLPLHEVGALLDASAVHGGRSVSVHLNALARTHRISSRRVSELLEQVGLSAAAKRRVGVLSLGMKQRLGIAAALLGDPGVLVFDEPVNGLDPDGIVWFRGLVSSLAAQGRTVLLSSHLMGELELTADALVIIAGGRLVAETSVGELADRFGGGVEVRTPRRAELAALVGRYGARVRMVGEAELVIEGLGPEQIGDVAAEAGIPLWAVNARKASLEDAYLALTGGG